MKIEELFLQENILPTAPWVVQHLINSFHDEHLSTDELAHHIALDPVLSINLLRLANSPYYRTSRQIGSVEAAVTLLGFVTVRTLVLTCSLVTSFKATPGLDLRQFWRYSLTTAVVGKWLAQRCGENPETAFTNGMLHGVGQLLMHLVMPAETAILDKLVAPYADHRLTAERDAFGYTHLYVSAELFTRWKFPITISTALQSAGQPFDPHTFDRQALILHLAAWAARACESSAGFAAARSKCPGQLVELLGLAPYALFDQMPSPTELKASMDELIG
ncbi:MAG: HDOD domain-containing protein [Sterolibacterium sp.]|nr:HDOD domain-containing protein [Sterolibacterium sp.]MBP9799550.1 HDOD domain-containing protein [Sterolibacterium sp.]